MTIGRRERKKQATRAALSEAAVRLSLTHGVEHVTIEQIADEADVAVRTFFNYFSGKEEAVVAGDAARGEVLVERFRSRPDSESVLEALQVAVLAHVDDLTASGRREALAMMRRSPSLLPHQLAAYAAGERALARAVAERIGELPAAPDDAGTGGTDGTDPPVGLYPALVSATVMAGFRVAMHRWTDAAAGGAPDVAVLHGIVGEVFARLAGGLDDR